MEETKRIIEINGVKLEVDLRKATVIDNYKVGDQVKVLSKEYQDTYKVSCGIITDFFYREIDGNQEAAMQILVLEQDYNGIDLKFKVFGDRTKDFSIAHFSLYEKEIDDSQVLGMFDSKINKLKEEIRILESKKNAYIKLFQNSNQ